MTADDGNGPSRGGRTSSAAAGTGEPTPWVETRAGGLFFVNAVLVAPELMALAPWVAGLGLRAAGLLEGPSRFIDPIPRVADYMLPRLGWILVIPAWTTIRNLRMSDLRAPARAGLVGMLVIHLVFLGYTGWRWLGGGSVTGV